LRPLPRPQSVACRCAPGHAGLDPASRLILDSGFRRNDGFDVYCCRSNKEKCIFFSLTPPHKAGKALASQLKMKEKESSQTICQEMFGELAAAFPVSCASDEFFYFPQVKLP